MKSKASFSETEIIKFISYKIALRCYLQQIFARENNFFFTLTLPTPLIHYQYFLLCNLEPDNNYFRAVFIAVM